MKKWRNKFDYYLIAYRPDWDERVVFIVENFGRSNERTKDIMLFEEFDKSYDWYFVKSYFPPPELEQYQEAEQYKKRNNESKGECSGLDITANPEHWVKMKNITNLYNPLSIWYW